MTTSAGGQLLCIHANQFAKSFETVMNSLLEVANLQKLMSNYENKYPISSKTHFTTLLFEKAYKSSSTVRRPQYKMKVLSSGCDLSEFSTFNAISVVITTGLITTDINIRADRDSIALQRLYIFHLGFIIIYRRAADKV